MPTLPIVPSPTVDGGELVVHSDLDVLALLPVEVRRVLSAPVRDALAAALTAILLEYQVRSTQGAALGDILRATGSSLDGLAEDYDRYRQPGETDPQLRARILSLDAMVTPDALLDVVNAIIEPFDDIRAKYFESELDGWFVHDGATDYAWDSFVFDDTAQASPRYPDRLYVGDAAENSGVALESREVLGAWAFADDLGRYFVLRLPDLSDEIFAVIVATVELLKGQGMRWQLYVDPLLVAPEPPLFDFDFTTLALGGHSAGSFLTATAVGNPAGLTFTRSTVSLVEINDGVGAFPIDSTPGVNYACIGNRTTTLSKRGLVIEHRVSQLLGAPADNSPRDLTVSWSVGSHIAAGGSTTGGVTAIPGADGIAAPTGVGCSSVGVPPPIPTFDGYYGPYANTFGGTRTCFSSFQRSWGVGDTSMQQEMNDGTPSSNDRVTVRAASLDWGRLVTLKGADALTVFTPVEGRDFSACGGQIQTSRYVYVDYVLFQSGNFPTTPIATGGTNREDDRLSYATGSDLIAANNQVRFRALFSPMHDTTDQVMYNVDANGTAAIAWFLWSWGTEATNYAYIRDSDKKLCVRIASGTQAVSTNAVAWTRYDVVEIFVAVGGGVASVAKYRVNGGAWVDLVLGTIADTPAPGANPIRILSNIDPATIVFPTADRGQLPCWLHRVTFYPPSGAPIGV